MRYFLRFSKMHSVAKYCCPQEGDPLETSKRFRKKSSIAQKGAKAHSLEKKENRRSFKILGDHALPLEPNSLSKASSNQEKDSTFLLSQ